MLRTVRHDTPFVANWEDCGTALPRGRCTGSQRHVHVLSCRLGEEATRTPANSRILSRADDIRTL